MKKLIVGYGVSGRAVGDYLTARGIEAVAVDRNARSMSAGAVPLLSEEEQIDFSLFDLAIVSPGIAPTHPVVQGALKAGVRCVGEIAFALESLENRCIGVTGTNGKTTVTLLTAHALREGGGVKARALGNVGVPLISYLPQADPEEVLVLELSSYQLESLAVKKLDAAILLNLTPDHLERHGTMRRYAEAKFQMGKCLKAGAPFFVSRQVADQFPDLAVGCVVYRDPPSSPDEGLARLRRGEIERENVEAAYLLSARFGVSRGAFDRALQTFQKPPHRITYVGEIGGVEFYNDSKGTNVDAVIYALKRFPGPVILLVGGVDKGASYAPWLDHFPGKVKRVLAYGAAREKIARELSRSSLSVSVVETLREAFERACGAAQTGDQILLSPGCASYDQFRNFEHRGEEFTRMVQERIEEKV